MVGGNARARRIDTRRSRHNAPEPPFIQAAKSPYLSDDEQSAWHFHRSGSPIYQRQNEADFSAPF